MPLPDDYGTGIVTGTFTDTNDRPVVGTISFTPSASRLIGTGAVILGDPVIVELDAEGSFSVTLPASDDIHVNPTDFTYRVDETFVGTVGSTYFIDVLEGTTLNLDDVSVPGTVNNGTVVWTAALPTQTGNAGEFLTTNGTVASWGPATAAAAAVSNGDGDAPMFRAATTVATYQATADAIGVPPEGQAITAGTLPYVVTADGDNVQEVLNNANSLAAYTLARNDSLIITAAAGDAEVAADAAAAVAEVGLLALDGEAALRSVTDGPATARQFSLCADWAGEGHDDRAWSTPKPASFSNGVWVDAVITVSSDRLDSTPVDGDLIYSEIATQTADGIGIWDGFEFAVESKWVAAIGQWEHRPFWEHTSSLAPGSAEDYNLSYSNVPGGWLLTEDQPTPVAVWIDFDTAGASTGYLLREAPDGSLGDITAGTRHWRIIHEETNAVTDIDPAITNDWFIGAGHGMVLTDQITIRDEGPVGTILASPNAADAWAEADGAFDDPQSNTWTPGPEAATQAGAPSDAEITAAIAAVAAATGSVAALAAATAAALELITTA